MGEAEKLVRALFAVARAHQPAVLFIDEIDSLLSQRTELEHESTRRLKTEFLVQLDGATTNEEDRLLVLAATNRPQEIDEAARRRFVKRLYIPLPDGETRKQMMKLHLKKEAHNLKETDFDEMSAKTDGYSGADVTNLCKEAALGPIRSLPNCDLHNIKKEQVRPISVTDFRCALAQVRASVSQRDLAILNDWNKNYGSSGE